MPSIRTISDIKANLLRPATTSHFEVEIPIIDALSFWKGADKQGQIQLLCSEASLPGSNLATFDINNDRMGVTEKHVHRRIFDDRIDLTFYVDAGIYKPIQFFEEWIDYITSPAEDGVEIPNAPLQKEDGNYFYRMRYPQGEGGYIANQGLKVTKFEKDQSNGGGALEYKFVNAYPFAINSMPVSYDTSSLLKCTVSMSYIRYYVKNLNKMAAYNPITPQGQARFNAAGLAGGIVNAAVDRLTGNDFLGDVAGGLAGRAVQNLF